MGRRFLRHPVVPYLFACAGYAGAAVLYTWPLVLRPGSTLTGTPSGDGGVYVWNQWVFRYELLVHGHFPYFTDRLFGAGQVADLSLHNYTVFLDLLALPLIGLLGVVTTFNLVYLVTTVLTAYTAYLLGRDLGLPSRTAWLTGLVFAWSPVLVTRGMGHYSLAAAAPLPLVLLLIRRLHQRPRVMTTAALGATIAWAAATDPYYAVYSLLIATLYLLTQHVSLHVVEPTPHHRLATTLTVLCILVGTTVAGIAATGGGQIELFDHEVGLHSLYTPVLVLTLLILARIGLSLRVRPHDISAAGVWTACRLTVVAGLSAGVLLSPFLYAIAMRVSDGRFVLPDILWRSSPKGVDLLALVLPNPNHPLAPAAEAAWLSAQPDGYLENVGSLPLTALLVCVLAWRAGWRPQRWLVVMTVFFGLLALGPFVRIAGHLTYIPTPWALLRFVPIVELARTPARFAVVLTLLFSLLYGGALTLLLSRGGRSRLIGATAAIVLAFELLPAPRQLFAADIPAIYRHVRETAPDAVLLELPFGLRDGRMSVGNFSARSQFYQTAHERTLMGGYLSRVTDARRRAFEQDPVQYPLALMSEGRAISAAARARLVAEGPQFVRTQHIAYVVIDTAYTPPPLQAAAIEAFDLEPVDRTGALQLFRPRHH